MRRAANPYVKFQKKLKVLDIKHFGHKDPVASSEQ
jgi:hypothetical protein